MSNNKEQAFLNLINQNQQRIQKICSIYAANAEDQRDLVQEVILNIWKAFPSFQGKASINTWLYRIILNVSLKWSTTIKKQKTVAIDSLIFEPVQMEANKIEQFEALKKCIGELDYGDRSIIILFLEEVSYKEIGAIVGISENYVAVKIKRIKKKLATCLTKNEA